MTAGYFNDTWPTFDREGEYLYFASQREFTNPIYEDNGTTWVYTNTDRLYACLCADDVPSPLAAGERRGGLRRRGRGDDEGDERGRREGDEDESEDE